MIEFEFLSDQNQNFPDSFHHSVNYEDMNLNVSIPVFSIHGNHDDISGTGRLSSMDILSSTGLLNYFGKWRDLREVEISPIVLKKNDNKVALYGLSHIHDARLARLFRDHKVNVRKPDIPDEEIFNLMVLHQNRADRGRFNYLPEDKLPGFLDLIIWGHEHDCRIQPEPNGKTKAYITQPGSSVATSLSEGESIEKHVGILEIHRKEFKINAVKLKTVRPFIFRSVNIDEFVDEFRLNEGDTRSKVEKFYSKNVTEMIAESKQRISGHNKQPTVPLIRLRIMYTNENHVINTARFGQKYEKEIANPESMLLFKKIISKRTKSTAYNPDELALKSAYDKKEQQDSVEDVVESYFNALVDEKDKLKLFSLKSLTEVCRLLVSKEDEDAAGKILERHYTKSIAFLEEKMCHEEDIADAILEFQMHKSKEAFNEAVVENSRIKTNGSGARQQTTDKSSDENDDGSGSTTFHAPAPIKPASGRGSRGGAQTKTSARGRQRKPASNDDSGSSDTLDIKKGRASTRQVSLAANSPQRSQRSASKGAVIFINSDSD